jgi:hypothetical protein
LSACGDDTSSKSKTNEAVNAETTIRGISGTAIDSNGHLIISYTDGTSQDVGNVVGSNGKDGTDGKNGNDGTDGQDGSVVTIGSCGHFIIDGKDTYYYAGQSGVIKINANGSKFYENDSTSITFNNVAAVDGESDLLKLENTGDHYCYGLKCSGHEIIYNDDGSISEAKGMCVNGIDDELAFMDAMTKSEDCVNNGVILLLDTSTFSNFHNTYLVRYSDKSIGDYYSSNNGTYYIYNTSLAVIEFDDGRQYEISINFSSYLSMEYDFGLNEGYTNLWTDYVLGYGDAFITGSKIIRNPNATPFGNQSTSVGFNIIYEPEEDDGVTSLNGFNKYYASIGIFVHDGEKETSYGRITSEEADLIAGQIYDLIKDYFIVYDADYYIQKYQQSKTSD